MKNLVIGLAAIMMISLFTVFQGDINEMQRNQKYIHQIAEEASATASLYYEEGTEENANTYDFSNGYIKFKETAGEKGYEIARLNLKLDDSGHTESKYYQDEINVYIYTFSVCDGTYTENVNGINTYSGYFEKGDCLSLFVRSPYKEMLEKLPESKQVYVNYPSVFTVIDAGKPKISESLHLDLSKVGIIRMGVYEYKHFN